MGIAGRVSLVCLILSFVGTFAKADDDHQDDDSIFAAAVRTRRRETHLISNWSVVLPSFVIHGIQPGQDAAAVMPRKIDGSGDAVVTPGIGLQFEANNGFMLLGAVLKDCYNDLAGTLQIGQFFKLGRTTQWGYTVGVYARETPLSCSGPNNYTPDGPSNCMTLDDYPWKFMTQVNNEWVDIIPMPFLHFSTALYKDKDSEIDFKILTNFALNEVGISIPF